MKHFTKIALAVALIGGASATALTVDSASARGWGNGPEQGQQFKGKRGGQRGPGGAEIFKQLDADKDGTLTKEELTTGLTKKITDNDTDGDNAVSLEEFKAEWEKITHEQMVRAFQRMDRDGSGKVTLEEISEPANAMFERMDRNDDGKLDKTDRPERQANTKRGGPRGDFERGKGPRGQFQQGQFQQGQFERGPNQPGQFGPNGPRGGQFQQGQFGQGPNQPGQFGPNGPRGPQFQNGNFGPNNGFGPGFEQPAPQGGPDSAQGPNRLPFPPMAQVR